MATSGSYWEALAEYADALKNMCRERKAYSLTEPTMIAHTSSGPIRIPRRIAEADIRWARAKTALRDAGRELVHDPGDEDRS